MLDSIVVYCNPCEDLKPLQRISLRWRIDENVNVVWGCMWIRNIVCTDWSLLLHSQLLVVLMWLKRFSKLLPIHLRRFEVHDVAMPWNYAHRWHSIHTGGFESVRCSRALWCSVIHWRLWSHCRIRFRWRIVETMNVWERVSCIRSIMYTY
jgi:hypothetical protein